MFKGLLTLMLPDAAFLFVRIWVWITFRTIGSNRKPAGLEPGEHESMLFSGLFCANSSAHEQMMEFCTSVQNSGWELTLLFFLFSFPSQTPAQPEERYLTLPR